MLSKLVVIALWSCAVVAMLVAARELLGTAKEVIS